MHGSTSWFEIVWVLNSTNGSFWSWERMPWTEGAQARSFHKLGPISSSPIKTVSSAKNGLILLEQRSTEPKAKSSTPVRPSTSTEVFTTHTSAEVHHDYPTKSFTSACKVLWNPSIRGTTSLLRATGYRPLLPLLESLRGLSLWCHLHQTFILSLNQNGFSNSLARLYLSL